MWGCHLGSRDSATSDLMFSTTEIDHFQVGGARINIFQPISDSAVSLNLIRKIML